ncbi:serine/threonine-protein kinase RsbW [Azospirillaceae bacterium]
MIRKLNISIFNDLDELSRLASAVDDFVTAVGVSSDIAFTLNVCFDELITNTISYGYSDNLIHEIFVGIDFDGQAFHIKIQDDANPFNVFKDSPKPDLESDLMERPIGGLGVFFVKQWMNTVSYHRENGYNFVCLEKFLISPPHPGV